MQDEASLTPEQPTEKNEQQRGGTNWLRETLETLIPAVLLALVINLFLAQATRVEGQSMEPNLHTDQRIVVEKLTYRFQSPERGDIVVLKSLDGSRELLIKRVIALPGETVEVHGGEVWINGQPLDEPYLDVDGLCQVPQMSLCEMSSRTVPEGHIFVMGDNREHSNDSRAFGAVPFENIVGHAWLSYWPPEKIGIVH
jgi:signal peptidase I